MQMMQLEPGIKGELKESRKVRFSENSIPVLHITPVEKQEIDLSRQNSQGSSQRGFARHNHDVVEKSEARAVQRKIQGDKKLQGITRM